MFELDPASGSIELPLWASAALAAVFVVLAALAFARTGVLRTLGAIALLAVLGSAVWLALDLLGHPGAGTVLTDSGERREFDRRVTDLLGRAMMPGSSLSCLEGAAGEQVAIGCEKLIFRGPETISTAVAYVSARLALLAEGVHLAPKDAAGAYGPSLNALRRGLESDRFGIVAYLMLQQPDCTAERCDALAMFRDPRRVRANLSERPFDVLVTRYSANWQLAGGGPEGPGTVATVPSGPAPANAPPGSPMSSRYDFPSSDSIPPVSIMTPEPPPAAKPAPAEQKETAAKPAAAESRPTQKKPAPHRTSERVPPAPPRAAAPTPLAPAAVAQ